MGDPPKVKTKKLYALLKHSKQNLSGVAALRRDGQTVSAETDNANILNAQFSQCLAPRPQKALSPLARNHCRNCMTLV